MNQHHLFTAFTKAISWNVFFYIIYKFFFVILTFLLYQKLTPSDFSQWATATSIIFLLLLWLNFGFKKSIPRFSPIFNTNIFFYKQGILILFLFKTSILFISAPLLYFALHFFIPAFAYPILVITLFITEGICELLLLIYHAHFYQKEYNLIQTMFLCLEMAINFLYLLFFSSTNIELSHNIIAILFIAKIIANSGIIIISIIKLPLLYKRIQGLPAQKDFPLQQQVIAFLKHTFIMWITSVAQSLSERNFLFPLITTVQGAPIANSFKVIHDVTLFFQRIPLKTIGIADTALLAHIETINHKPEDIRSAFIIIFKTLFIIAIPLSCLGTYIFLKNQSISQQNFFLFFIIIICSSLELLLSPYIRVLEVKFHYKPILLSHLFYVIGFILLVVFYIRHSLSLLPFIGTMCILRLLSMLFMTFAARNSYHMKIPTLFSSVILIASLFLTLLAWILW